MLVPCEVEYRRLGRTAFHQKRKPRHPSVRRSCGKPRTMLEAHIGEARSSIRGQRFEGHAELAHRGRARPSLQERLTLSHSGDRRRSEFCERSRPNWPSGALEVDMDAW